MKVKLKKLLDDVWFQNLHNSIKILFFMNVYLSEEDFLKMAQQ